MTLDEALARLRAARPSLAAFPIRSLAVFGSVARNEATATSDVDVLVEFSAPVGLLTFVRFKRELERVLGTHVHLATVGALRHDSRDRILKEAVRAA